MRSKRRLRSARSNPEYVDRLRYAMSAGIAGAATVAVLDGVISRSPAFNDKSWMRGVIRIIAGGTISYAAARVGAPQSVSDGAIIGTVLVTSLDVGVSLIGRRGIEPPKPSCVSSAGLPWPPKPTWSV